MISFFGQPKYAKHEFIGYELFLREYVDGKWHFPDDFGKFDAAEFADALINTLHHVSGNTQMVSINLDPDDFVSTRYIHELSRAQFACPTVQIIVELTEHNGRVSLKQLAEAANSFRRHDLWVCLDDVGTGENQINLVSALAPYVQEYKFALQNFHNQKDFITLVTPQLQFWREQASIADVIFAIEGFETQSDLQIAHNYHADLLQGYYFGRPHLLQ
ncbi:EAL domain-containing protein [Lacticaseibacillus zhaodongensis]|uniref:EAL domain-containing protein n=1 Tax=Lacticaseibacillus zhaodongensis TaxID=2668065 RepID=UPI0012D2C668|nr:EAL domain-containing protein [Lacticaseibacillus zhaodongensis]